jgi:hypothetical protein
LDIQSNFFFEINIMVVNRTQAARRVKRTGGAPSLSIVNPLDVLRQRLLLEIARRRMRQSQDQIQANREILQTIGKRDINQSEQRTNEQDDDDNDDVDSEFMISSTDEKSGNVNPENNR